MKTTRKHALKTAHSDCQNPRVRLCAHKLTKLGYETCHRKEVLQHLLAFFLARNRAGSEAKSWLSFGNILSMRMLLLQILTRSSGIVGLEARSLNFTSTDRRQPLALITRVAWKSHRSQRKNELPIYQFTATAYRQTRCLQMSSAKPRNRLKLRACLCFRPNFASDPAGFPLLLSFATETSWYC